MTEKMQSPVILIGHGRSGTSILGRLMREYLGVGFGTESQFIVDYYRRLPKYGSLEDDSNLRRLVNDLLKERWFQRSRKFNEFGLNEATILAAIQDRTYTGVLDAIFTLFASHLGMSRWGDKTPAYIHHLDVIHELFPNAKYVYLVRDGRDVAMSVLKSYFGPNNIYSAARDWKETVVKGDRFARSLADDQIHCLRYEDLVSNPVATFKDLVTFLEIEDTGGQLAARIEAEIPSEMMTGNFDKWRTAWTEQQRLVFERHACDALRTHGYETMLDQPSGDPGFLINTYWSTLNELGRWRHLGYWKDNLYKARLRLSRL